MNLFKVYAILAGLFFGAWPLFMNKSGLTGHIASAVFAFVVVVFMIPFAFLDTGDLSGANWAMAVTAGLFGALGVLTFNAAVVKVPARDLPQLFILMILVQASVPVVYQAVIGGMTPLKGVKLTAAALVAAWLTV